MAAKAWIPDVAGHPMLFVTLTAPSFGPVHRGPGPSEREPCRPRRREPLCPHGIPLACFARHETDDPVVGEPLCPECFDYPGAVLWNAHVAAPLGADVAAPLPPRRPVRRGLDLAAASLGPSLLHQGGGVPAPGSGPPPCRAPRRRCGRPRRRTAGMDRDRTVWNAPSERRCGAQTWLCPKRPAHRCAGPGGDPRSTSESSTRAKNATRGAWRPTWPSTRPRRPTAPGGWPIHCAPGASSSAWRSVRTWPGWCARPGTSGTGGSSARSRSGSHAHTLGYRGQFSSKSRRYSTTFGALRGARAAYVEDRREDPFDYDGEWRYAGRGFDSPEAAELARSLHQAARALPQTVPHSFPISSQHQ